ncbi:MFS transporter [Tautonia plasticadhaerens]|uniref:Putative sulfoacetate transporter SauU n=1 Tax=Tautonia plasticadhaerens TaxID=2527974 RepID=A0A518GVF7_9BACT|nr:MFS transporter [Tautonia plasticadhaerens]QDV32572.1 putative sulfoacetate transporter SauU [Tautonia plasticadhaerens]
MIGGSPDRPTNVRWGVFALACGMSFLLYLHRYTWNIVGPKLQEEYGFSNTQAGLLFSLFYYTYALGQIPSGVVVDRFGPHRFLSAIVVLWSLSLAALGQTAMLWLLGAWRLVFGAAQAGCYPALTKVTRSWFPAGRRTVLQGWIATTFGRGGGALSPILLGTLLMGGLGLSWETSLIILGGLGLAYGLVFFVTFRNSPDEHPGVNERERALIGEGSTGSGPKSRAVLPAGRTFRSRSMRFFVLQQFLDAGSDVVFVSLIGTYFLRARGFDIAQTGWLASLPLWGGALGGIAGGWLNDRLIAATGSRRWSRSGVGFVGKLIGCVMLALVVRQPGGVAAAWVLMVAKFFSDWSQPTVWGTCTDLGGRFSATVFSVINTAGTLGGVVMPLVFGVVLDAFTTGTGPDVISTDWGPLFVMLSAMYLGSGLCWLLIDCTRSLDVEEKPTALDPESI